MNKERLEELWNGRHVDSLEVVMKETEDCEGRTAFYEVHSFLCPLVMGSCMTFASDAYQERLTGCGVGGCGRATA